MKIPTNVALISGPLALGVCAVLALSACGSSKATVTPGAQPEPSSTTSSTTTAPAATGPIVMTSSTPLGKVLVDGRGMTLYTLTNAGQQVPCTGQCASFWPPLLLPTGAMTAMGAPGVTGLGTATAAGGLQVTANGAPLYRFSIDKAPGDTKGEGVSSFGGTWHVAKADAAAAAVTTTLPYGY